MFYLLILIIFVVVPIYVLASKKPLAWVTSGESFIALSPEGKWRSWLYLISVIISLSASFIYYIVEWLYSSDTIAGLFVPLTYLVEILYGSAAARKVFLICALEIVCLILYVFSRTLSAKMVYFFIQDGNCTDYKYIKRLIWVLIIACISNTALAFLSAEETYIVAKIAGTKYDYDLDTSFISYNGIWITSFVWLVSSFAKNKKIFGRHPTIDESNTRFGTRSFDRTKTNKRYFDKKRQSTFNDFQHYKTFKTSRLGAVYTMNDYLQGAVASAGKLDLLEMYICTSEFLPHMLAHIGIAISLISGNDLWYITLLYLMTGFFVGKLLTLSATFMIYNMIVNFVMVFYNFVQKYFVIDIVLFAIYTFYLKEWWRIFIHIAAFLIAQNVLGFIFHKERCKTFNRCAWHLISNAKNSNYYDTEEKEESSTQPEQPSSPQNSNTADETRLTEIEEELKKIPVTKVKQWYADGKLTEEQYKSIARKYNALKKERADILERMELLRNI